MTYRRKAIPFDMFAGNCKYFDSDADVNNGYGCSHPEQEEKQEGKGCCFCFSCPLGVPADEESFEEPDIDWDGTEKEDVGEDDYIIVPVEPEKMSLEKDKTNHNLPECFLPEKENPYPLCTGQGKPECEECQLRADWEPEDPYGVGV